METAFLPEAVLLPPMAPAGDEQWKNFKTIVVVKPESSSPLGVHITSRADGSTYASECDAGSLFEISGVRNGDRILRIDGEQVNGAIMASKLLCKMVGTFKVEIERGFLMNDDDRASSPNDLRIEFT